MGGVEKRLRGDTLVALQRAQMDRERLLKLDQREAAARYVMAISNKHDWSPEDTQEVLLALGLPH